MYKQAHEFMNINFEPFLKTIYSIVFALSLFVIFYGVSGIIEHKSPENLASLATLSSGFITYFKYHILIISGALFLTFSVRLLRKNS